MEEENQIKNLPWVIGDYFIAKRLELDLPSYYALQIIENYCYQHGGTFDENGKPSVEINEKQLSMIFNDIPDDMTFFARQFYYLTLRKYYKRPEDDMNSQDGEGN